MQCSLARENVFKSRRNRRFGPRYFVQSAVYRDRRVYVECAIFRDFASEHGNFHSEAKSSGAAAHKSAINFIEAKHKQEEKDKSIATLVRPSGQSPSRQPVIYLVENHGENHNGTNNNLAVTLFDADEDDSGADHLND